jgi:signal transduction histidine kinase
MASVQMRALLLGILKYAGILAAMAVILWRVKEHSYLLFHSLAEVFSIVIAGGIFMVAWNTRRFQTSGYLAFLGLAYLFIAFIDLLHALAFTGMRIFADAGSNLATQFWIAGRFMESISLLAALLFIRRRLPAVPVLGLYAAATAAVVAIIFHGWFPRCFDEETGLTPFKRYSEYLICLILLAALAMIIVNHRRFDRRVLYLLSASLVVTIGSELCFTLYRDPYHLYNWLGHVLKIISFYLVYKAIIETGLSRPYGLMFRDLKQREHELEEARATAEQANQAKDQFLAVLSHELRNPLNPVLMSVSAMQREPGLSDTMRRDLEMIHRNVMIEARLIDDLLDLTRITRGKLELSLAEVDAHAVLQYALEICQLDAKPLEIALDLDARHHHVRADPARLQQVL